MAIIKKRIRELDAASGLDGLYLPGDKAGLDNAVRFTTETLADFVIANLVAGDIPDLSGTYATVAGLRTGRTVWVDDEYGSDGTAAVDRPDRPFKTLAAAKAAAASGDRIVVRPGTYNEKNLLKDGVDWHFEAGAVVDYTGAATGGIFDDSATGANGAVVCNVTGHGEFKYRTSTTSYHTDLITTPYNAVKITNAGSDVSITGKQVYAEWTDTGNDNGVNAILHKGGTLRFKLERLVGMGPGSPVTAYWWEDGDCYGRADYVSGCYGSLYFAPLDVEADVFISCDVIEGNLDAIAAGKGVLYYTSAPVIDTPDARVWLDVKDCRVGVSHTNGKFYFKADKIRDAFNGPVLSVEQYAELWLNAQKITVNELSGVTFVPSLGTGRVVADIEHVENTAGSGTSFLLALSGNVECRVGDLVMAADATRGVSLGATARFSGRVDGSAATAGNPVSLSASGGLLGDVLLVANGAQACIVSDLGTRSVAVTGSLSVNTTVASGVTLTSNLRLPTVLPAKNNTYNFGSSSFRAATMYTNDLDAAATVKLPASAATVGPPTLQFGGTNDGINGGPAVLDGGVQVFCAGAYHTIFGKLSGRFITALGGTMEYQISGNIAMYVGLDGVLIGSLTPHAPASTLDVFGTYTATKVTTGSPAYRPVFNIAPVWADSVDATRKARVVVSVFDAAGTREALRAQSDGANAVVAIGGAVTTAKLKVAPDVDQATLELWRFGSSQTAPLVALKDETGSTNLMLVDRRGYFAPSGMGFFVSGNAVLGQLANVTLVIPSACVLEWAHAHAESGPTGDDLVLDIIREPAAGGGYGSIFSIGTELTIDDGDTEGETTTFATSTFVRGDKLKLDVLNIGSTAPGAYVIVTLAFQMKNVN